MYEGLNGFLIKETKKVVMEKEQNFSKAPGLLAHHTGLKNRLKSELDVKEISI